MSHEMQADLLEIGRLVAIMAKLRDPNGGCPWDLEQTHASIARYALEEAYEVVDAIERGDITELREELGDLLLQVVFHAQMASEAGHFSLSDVARSISDKMQRRHPHVFGEVDAESAEAVTASWEALKAEERKAKQTDTSILADIPDAFPALVRAQKLQKRAASVGFDWLEAAPVYAKIEEELQEVREAVTTQQREEEVGDLLFAVVNLARHYQIDAETALRYANQKFERRFRYIESNNEKTMQNSTLEEMEALWQQAKRA